MKVRRQLELQGWQQVEAGKRISQCNIDLYARYSTGSVQVQMIVECKNHGKARVRLDKLKTFYGDFAAARKKNKADVALFVTTVGFTPTARAYAEEMGIQLSTWQELCLTSGVLNEYAQYYISNYEAADDHNCYIEVFGSRTPTGASFPLSPHINRLLSEHDHQVTLLLSDFGIGKTTFCRRLVYEQALQYSTGQHRSIPIYINLQDFNARFGIPTLVLNTLQSGSKLNITLAACKELLQTGGFQLFFDGYEEMEAKADLHTIHRCLDEIRTVALKNKCVLTCRTHFFNNQAQAKKLVAPDHIFYLSKWTKAQITSYLTYRLGPAPGIYNTCLSPIYGCKVLASTPYFLQKIVSVISDKKYQDSSTGFYQYITDTWLEEQSHRKSAIMTLDERRSFMKKMAVRYFCSDDCVSNHKEFCRALRRYWSAIENREGFNIDDAALLNNISNDLQTNTFFVRDASGNYTFSHRPIMEFFLAQAITGNKKLSTHLKNTVFPQGVQLFLDEMR